MDVPGLNDLIHDSMTLAAKHTLTEVFLHLEERKIEFYEIIMAVGDICAERGYADALKKIEEIATDIRFSPICKEKKG